MNILLDILNFIFWSALLLVLIIIGVTVALGILGIGFCDVDHDEEDHRPWV